MASIPTSAAAAAIKKWDVKTWALVAVGGIAVVASAAFVMQAKHAALGRQVGRNVTKFLINHGSQVHSGIISGGIVSNPMKTDAAINATVVSMLNMAEDEFDNAGTNPESGEESQITTGIGGVQGRSRRGNVKPAASGSPRPAASPTSPRGKAPASVIRNPSESISDDSGWASETGRTSGGKVEVAEYNPDEFTPRGPKPPSDLNLFEGDGIPSTSSTSSVVQPQQSGYE